MYHIISDEKLDKLIETRAAQKLARAEKRQQNELLEKQVSIAMLQAQINPHFLYNALECIRGQALLKNVPEIAEITQALSGYFRYSVSMHDHIVTLHDELNNVNNYVLIQKYRFNNRFSLNIEIADEDPILYNVAMPKLTLQPLIENAVIHAFSNVLKKSSVITISAQSTQRHINLHVADNGVGMSADVLKVLNEKLTDSDARIEQTGHGIALLNVHRRLSLIYGKEYGLNISSAVNIGTDIELHIPRITPEELKARQYEQ